MYYETFPSLFIAIIISLRDQFLTQPYLTFFYSLKAKTIPALMAYLEDDLCFKTI